MAFFTSRAREKPALEVPVTLEVCELDDKGVRKFMGVYLREKKGKAGKRETQNVDVGGDFAELQRKGLLAERGIGRNPYWLRLLVWSNLRTRNRGELFLNFACDLISRNIGTDDALILKDVPVKLEERKRKWAIVPLNVEMDALAELALMMSSNQQVGLE